MKTRGRWGKGTTGREKVREDDGAGEVRDRIS